MATALWQWKAPSLIRRRLEMLTGHRVTVGSVSLNHRLEILAHDVRIAGAPPFESQTLARAERVVVRLRGPRGFWSPSKVVIDGMDIEYLGTSTGDNLRIPSPRVPSGPLVGGKPVPVASPQVVARNVRLRGSLAVPHGARIEFRVPQAEFERKMRKTRF